MRQFDVAERNRQRQGLGVTLLPRQDFTIGLNGTRTRDKYPDSQFGLQAQNTDNYTVDATLTPDESQSWSLYYTRQNMMWQQSSRAYNSFQKASGSANPANDWTAQHQDKIDSVGVNVTWVVLDDKLSLRLGYDYAASKTDINFSANPASTVNTPPTDMPTLRGKRHTLELSGTYTVRDNLTARAGATLESYRVNDWATDGFAPGSSSVPDVLLLSGSTGSYRAVILHTTLTCRF